jgi:DNA repair exonuclease SbcCD ATPase subunit
VVTISVTEQNLEERIFRLQKLDLNPDVQKVVEEAARLFAEGRHLEAGALVEKAEALGVAAGEAGTPDEGRLPGENAAEEQAVAGLIANLATGVAKVLATALHDLEGHIFAESRKFTESFSRQIGKLQAAVESLMPLGERIEQLTQAVSEQRSVGAMALERCEQLSAALQEAGARHELQIGALRDEAQASSAALSERLDALAGGLGAQKAEFVELKSAVSEVSPRVAALADRLDRQAEAIRRLYERHHQREATLDQLAEVLARRKDFVDASPGWPEGQL